MKKNRKIISICIGVILVGGIFFGFSKADERNFQFVKSLDIFNSVLARMETRAREITERQDDNK